MHPEQGPSEKDKDFKAPETSADEQELSQEGSIESEQAAQEKAYNDEIKFWFGEESWSEERLKEDEEKIEKAIAGSRDVPGNYLEIKGKTSIEAAQILSNNDSFGFQGIVAALELADVPKSEKAKMLAEAYDKYAQVLQDEDEGKRTKVHGNAGSVEYRQKFIEKAERLRGKQ